MRLHVLENFGEAVFFSAADFGGGPASVADVLEGGADGGPVDVTLADVTEAVFDAPVFHVEFDDALA